MLDIAESAAPASEYEHIHNEYSCRAKAYYDTCAEIWRLVAENDGVFACIGFYSHEALVNTLNIGRNAVYLCCPALTVGNAEEYQLRLVEADDRCEAVRIKGEAL